MAIKIGIPVPTSNDLEYNIRNWPQYAAAVERVGGDAVRLDLHLPASDLRVMASFCQGFVLPGSPADVAPAGYGQEPDPETAPADPARETCDRMLLEHAMDSGKPVLAICFGVQFLNVWNGGTLLQDVHPVPVNHAAGSSVAIAHSVLVVRESLLAGLLTQAEAPGDRGFRRLPVNSSHHQAIAVPGDDLAVVARSVEDGVIEAVEGRIGRSAIVGVQWHPERSVDVSAASRALFLWLVSAAGDGQAAAQELSDAHAL